jgi:hypothetical protein
VEAFVGAEVVVAVVAVVDSEMAVVEVVAIADPLHSTKTEVMATEMEINTLVDRRTINSATIEVLVVEVHAVHVSYSTLYSS